MSRRRLLAAVLILVAASGTVAVGCCTPQLVTAAMTPRGDFDTAAVPEAPRYDDDGPWLALPTRRDEADVSLTALPAVEQAAAPVDVFFLHSTSSVAPSWNASTDDLEVRSASIRGGTLIQASVFNGCCAVYAPTYRQASGIAFTTPSSSGDAAIDVAYSDVRAAFEAFLARSRAADARPFVLAAHSQGAVLGARLLRDRISGSPEAQRLVAAYLPGAPLSVRDLGAFHACAAPDEVGCVVTYNARGPGHVRNAIDFGANVDEATRLCVNPVVGATTSEVVPRTRHGGALFFDAEAPAVLPAFATTACQGGRLVVSDMQPIPKRDAMSGVLMWIMGGENYHPIEYQLFYVDLRRDVQRRVDAFVSAARLAR